MITPKTDIINALRNYQDETETILDMNILELAITRIESNFKGEILVPFVDLENGSYQEIVDSNKRAKYPEFTERVATEACLVTYVIRVIDADTCNLTKRTYNKNSTDTDSYVHDGVYTPTEHNEDASLEDMLRNDVEFLFTGDTRFVTIGALMCPRIPNALKPSL